MMCYKTMGFIVCDLERDYRVGTIAFLVYTLGTRLWSS